MPVCSIKNCKIMKRVMPARTPEQFEQWQIALNRHRIMAVKTPYDFEKCLQGKPYSKCSYKNFRICYTHFTDDDFEKDLQAELMGLERKPKLKLTAMPSLNLELRPNKGNQVPLKQHMWREEPKVTRKGESLKALPEVGRLEEELVDDFEPGDLVVDNNSSNEQEGIRIQLTSQHLPNSLEFTVPSRTDLDTRVDRLNDSGDGHCAVKDCHVGKVLRSARTLKQINAWSQILQRNNSNHSITFAHSSSFMVCDHHFRWPTDFELEESYSGVEIRDTAVPTLNLRPSQKRSKADGPNKKARKILPKQSLLKPKPYKDLGLIKQDPLDTGDEAIVVTPEICIEEPDNKTVKILSPKETFEIPLTSSNERSTASSSSSDGLRFEEDVVAVKCEGGLPTTSASPDEDGVEVVFVNDMTESGGTEDADTAEDNTEKNLVIDDNTAVDNVSATTAEEITVVTRDKNYPLRCSKWLTDATDSDDDSIDDVEEIAAGSDYEEDEDEDHATSVSEVSCRESLIEQKEAQPADTSMGKSNNSAVVGLKLRSIEDMVPGNTPDNAPVSDVIDNCTTLPTDNNITHGKTGSSGRRRLRIDEDDSTCDPAKLARLDLQGWNMLASVGDLEEATDVL